MISEQPHLQHFSHIVREAFCTALHQAARSIDYFRLREAVSPLKKSPFQLRPKYWTNKQVNKIATAATTLPPIKIVFSIR